MDYEKKYNEALERARELQENSNGMILKKWLWGVFPELKESEDERIRKALKQGFFQYGNSFTTFGGLQVGDILAWLEKQGEKKPAENVKILDADKVIEWLTANVRLYASLNFLYESNCPQGDVEVESLIKSFKKDFGL